MPLEIEIGGPELQKKEGKKEEEKEKREWNESVEKYLKACKECTYKGRSRGNVDRNQKEDKRSNAKEESEDKEMGHGGESVIWQGVEREEKRDDMEGFFFYLFIY